MENDYEEMIEKAFEKRIVKIFEKYGINDKSAYVCYRNKWKGLIHEDIEIYRCDNCAGLITGSSSDKYLTLPKWKFICKYDEIILNGLDTFLSEWKPEYDEEIERKKKCLERLEGREE